MRNTIAIGMLHLFWTTVSIAQSVPVSYDGFTEPSTTVLVAALEMGRLEEIAVKVGDKVKGGDVIARLEDGSQVSSLKIAKFQASMRGELEAAGAERDLQRAKITNLRTLSAEQMTRPDELSRAETELRITEARYLTAQEQDQFRKLEVERFELQIQRRKILAPMNGVIAEVLHQSGEYITPGDAAVVRLIVLDTIYGTFSVPVEEVDAMKVGTSTAVFLRSSGETVMAKVESLAPEIDGESGTVRVRVALPNPDGKIRVGDQCTMRLLTSPVQSATSPLRGRTTR
jgi:RND family efflux transporter MFP subunit